MEWSCWLLVKLYILALQAVAAHSCHMFAYALPDKKCSHHTLGGMYARVGHTVNGVEDCSSVAPGTRGLVMPRATSHSRLSPRQSSLSRRRT